MDDRLTAGHPALTAAGTTIAVAAPVEIVVDPDLSLWDAYRPCLEAVRMTAALSDARYPTGHAELG